MPAFEIENIPSQKGRIAIVTGANIGLGFETSLAFSKKNIKVIMACRNIAKAEKAKQDIIAQVPSADLEIIQLDLSQLKSVRTFAKEFLSRYQKLDLLVNNAGLMMPPYSKTEDGFESQFGTNHLGHFLLTGLLLDIILKTPNSRIVSLSSNAHKSGKINFSDLQSEKKYSSLKAYNQSKLACLMYSFELQQRLEKNGSSTLSVAAHPGASNTNLMQYLPKFLLPLMPLFTQSAAAGAEPTLYAALGTDVKGGSYFGPSGFGQFTGRAKKVESSKRSKDIAVAKKLWEVSEELTDIKYL